MLVVDEYRPQRGVGLESGAYSCDGRTCTCRVSFATSTRGYSYCLKFEKSGPSHARSKLQVTRMYC